MFNKLKTLFKHLTSDDTEESSSYLIFNKIIFVHEIKSFINTITFLDCQISSLSNNHIRNLQNIVLRNIIDDVEDLNKLVKKINHYINSNSNVNIDTEQLNAVIYVK